MTVVTGGTFDEHVTTLNFPSTVEMIDLDELENYRGKVGCGLETINIPYSVGNTYVTSDDGKALFLNTSPDLTLCWINIDEASS